MHDESGFIKSVQELTKRFQESGSSGTQTRVKNGIDSNSITSLMQDLFDDRDRFQNEIALQLQMKVQDHVLGKKRTEKDFVKPKLNEVGHINLLDRQMADMEENLERGAKREDEEDFNREAYDQLKK